jgi:hypothetical protein
MHKAKTILHATSSDNARLIDCLLEIVYSAKAHSRRPDKKLKGFRQQPFGYWIKAMP